MKTRQALIYTSTILVFLFFHLEGIEAKISDPYNIDSVFEKANQLRYQQPEEAIILLENFYKNSLQKKDTTIAIETYLELANIYGHQANYKVAYDKLWAALFLADAARMEQLKAKIHLSIGRYYSFYKRRSEALKYFDASTAIKRKLIEKGKLTNADLVVNFYNYCATFRELNEPQLAQAYLDSCFLFFHPSISLPNMVYLKFERANLFRVNQQYDQALDLYKELIPWMESNAPAYQVLLFSYLGDAYKNMGDLNEGETYYKKAIEVSKTYKSHIDFRPLVHEKLSNLYLSKNDYVGAYNQIIEANTLNANFFDSRSKNNLPLLEIQDSFRKQQEEQQKMIREQRLTQLEQEERVLFLQRIILIGLIAFLLIIGSLYFKYVQSKYRTEKQLIRKKQELELQKANEILELKNKELATSALKLIEKDEFIATLKDKLSHGKGDINRHEIKQIVRSISHNNAENWKEFETRFVAVNKSFYEKLNLRFPKLTPGDQKLCALVKLNFSSKDMAKLLGISVESVHTTRYRLRKKLKLSRDINLSEFIASI